MRFFHGVPDGISEKRVLATSPYYVTLLLGDVAAAAVSRPNRNAAALVILTWHLLSLRETTPKKGRELLDSHLGERGTVSHPACKVHGCQVIADDIRSIFGGSERVL